MNALTQQEIRAIDMFLTENWESFEETAQRRNTHEPDIRYLSFSHLEEYNHFQLRNRAYRAWL